MQPYETALHNYDLTFIVIQYLLSDEINAYLEMCSAKYMFAENCQAGMAVEAAMTTDVKVSRNLHSVMQQ